MLKETRIVPVYPEDATTIPNTISTYELFGWSLISNNICEELDSNGNVFAAFNKLTFQRDKENPNYFEFVRLENRYNDLQAQRIAWEMLGGNYSKEYALGIVDNYGLKPRFNVCGFILGFVCGIIPGIAYCVHYCKKSNAFYERLEAMNPQEEALRNIEHAINDVITDVKRLAGRVPVI